MAAAYLFAPMIKGRDHGCAKKAYDSRQMAVRVLRRHPSTSTVTQMGKGILSVYQCQSCMLWHLGHRRVRRAT